MVKAAAKAASKLASNRHGDVAAPHMIARQVSDAGASEATMRGVPAQKTAQLAGIVLRDAGMPQHEAYTGATLAASKTALAEGKEELQALVEAAKATKSAGATEAQPGKHVTDVASSLPEAKDRTPQRSHSLPLVR